jgi:uncharacterized protein YxjI
MPGCANMTAMADNKPPRPDLKKPQGPTNAERVKDQVRRQAGLDHVEGGGGTLFTEPILVVNQKPKIIEMVNEYLVYDQHGNKIGSVAEVGQNMVKIAARFVSSVDQFFTHKYEIRDADENCVMVMVRPRKIMKSSFVVSKPDGTEIGKVKQRNMLGKIKFLLSADGKDVGSINAENWRAWNFHVKDGKDREVARVTKTWEGLGTTLFTTADNFVLEIKEPLEDPLLSLVVATTLCIDTALKQDDRGFN